jgi:hypothetical protein
MPTLADMEAAKPKCDRLCGSLAARGACGKPMRWQTLTDPQDGVWVCVAHGPMMSGLDAAMRAGYISYIYVEMDSEAA